MNDDLELVTLEEAARIVGKTPANIRDYIQRGRIAKYNPSGERITRAESGQLRVSLKELRIFLALIEEGLAKHHHAGLHPELGFYQVPEHERTKHVHRLHPYLGKFIPQLVEWFLARFFRPEDVILDPFMGSGTTLVQANEMRMHAIGIEISPFNCLIAKVKLTEYDVARATFEILDIEKRVTRFSNALVQFGLPASLAGLQGKQVGLAEQLLPDGGSFGGFALQEVKNGKLFQNKLSMPSLFAELETDWTREEVTALTERLLADCQSDYLRTWFAPRALIEMLYYRQLIGDYHYQDLLRVVLSRAVRSSRLIPHYDLATPKKPLPVGKEYWCRKHNRYCIPIDNCLEKIHAYSEDTARRIAQFKQLRSDCGVVILQSDSRKVDLAVEVPKHLVAGRLPAIASGEAFIDGVFTSPPYVGQIDYHDQHTYAYELFGFPRQDALEIGPKRKGKSKKAQQEYVQDISAVFRNILPCLKPQARVFVVANDRFHLYPEIARLSGLRIVDEYHRAVTKRTEQGDDPYQETIFFMMKAQPLHTNNRYLNAKFSAL